MKRETFAKSAILLIVILTTIALLTMIRPYLMVTLLAGIFAALMYPVYIRLLKWFRGVRVLASLATVFVIILVFLLPLGILTGLVTAQAIQVGKSVSPWVQSQIANPVALEELLQALPFDDYIEPYFKEIIQKVGEIVNGLSRLLLSSFSSATLRTVHIFFLTFIFLYSLYYLLINGKKILDKIIANIPLKENEKHRLLTTFTSVTRATLKSTAVLCILQGGLAGVAFWVVGIPSALFWGVIMMVCAIIPLIGMTLIWGPAALILVAYGSYAKAIGLAVFCGLVIPGSGYILNPILVGKDIKMNDLMILLGTLGGIYLFGFPGIIIGPIIAALFVTSWEIYGVVFQDVLPEITSSESNG